MFVVLTALALLSPFSAEAYTVKSFAPQGTVKYPRQVRVVFSDPMVAFGDPRGPEPFTVKCTRPGKGLWEDSRTWIYEFSEEIPSGENCQFIGKKDLKNERGEAWSGDSDFSFETGGPAVTRVSPSEDDSLEQKPAFALWLDAATDSASAVQNTYLLVEGLPERIPVNLLTGKVRDEIIRSANRYMYGEEKKVSPERILVVQSSRVLPADKRIQLVWGKGIRSSTGSVTTEDQYFAYHTEKPFRAEFNCERENAKAGCLPIASLQLSFNSSVPAKFYNQIRLRSGKTVRGPKKQEKPEDFSYVSFDGPFPPNTKFQIELPKSIRDEKGRALSNIGKFPLAVATGPYSPLAKFAATFGILEAQDPVLPISVRKLEGELSASRLDATHANVGPKNITELMDWIARLRRRDYSYSNRGTSIFGATQQTQAFKLPKPNGPDAFEVIGIPLGKKGFHVVEVESQILGKSLLGSGPMYVASGALVTNLAVHLKWGKESSLIWVTALDSGKPVAGARVRAADCNGKVVWEGKTDDQGTVLSADIPAQNAMASCNYEARGDFSQGLFVVAEKEDDFSFVHSGWDDGIETWRFQVPAGSANEDEGMAHTVFDRTLFRAGQTVHMKHFLRERFLRGLRQRQGKMPVNLVLMHSSGSKIVQPLKFNSAGVAESTWAIPKNAELGNYSVYLTVKEEKSSKSAKDTAKEGEDGEGEGEEGEGSGFYAWGEGVYQSGSFRVEEFRIPIMAGSVQWPAGTLVSPAQVGVDLHVRYLSGGGASGLPVKMRSRAERLEFVQFPAFDDIVFANGSLKPGRFRRGEDETRANQSKGEVQFPEQNFTLDMGGGARATVKNLPQWDQPTRVALEAEYRDPNGEIQTASGSTTLYPSTTLLGIKPSGWAAQQDQVKFKVAAANPSGKPLAGTKVKVRWLTKKSYSHRKRIVGGFYSYENFEEVKVLGEACQGTTDEKGFLECTVKAPETGNMVLVAEAEGVARPSRAHQEIYVAGQDSWFAQQNDDRIDLLPEKKAYEPGETARFQVRSPFRQATALITVEREGVVERFVRTVEGQNPMIEIPVLASYAPNVFVSALLVRGRVGDPAPTALVDLARPAHKLGLAKINVGWKAHRLDVTVASNKAEYKVREKAKVKVRVLRAVDGKPASDGEVLIAAVDEGLLELMKNRSWDLLDAMMGERNLKVRTSTAQSQVIGKRHYGMKSLPPGGGGGQSTTRELFDTLLFWKATLRLDGNGEAEAEVPMNDSLSSFRIVAVASEAADRFGTGAVTVRTRQDLMLFSGVTPLARQGDEARPEVTVRNASGNALRAEVAATVGGAALGEKQTVELAPGASRTLFWKQSVPLQIESQTFEFTATAGDSRDQVKVTQKVEPPLRDSVLQATLERLDPKLSVPVQRARDSMPGFGGITVKIDPRLASNLEGVRRYMSAYPYSCLEQRTSRAVALRNADQWKGITEGLSAYIDSAGLLKYFPEALWGSETLSTYFLSVSHEAGFEIPEAEKERILTGLVGFIEGKFYRSGFIYPAADLSVRKLAAMEALSRYQRFDPKYLELIQVQPNLWPVKSLLDWVQLLRREEKIPERAKLLTQAETILRARVEWRGTVVAFKDSIPLWWLMSSMDEDANRLLLVAATEKSWTDDIGRLVRGSLARQRSGHWDLTTSNAWGVLAMERFSSEHEKEKVTGKSEASLGGKKQSVAWASGQEKRVPLEFAWPAAKQELTVKHEGGGKPWVFFEARAAVKLKEPIFKGYRLVRTVKPVVQKKKGEWNVGDVYRVTLKIEAPADMTWVAVSDPIPAGATVLGSGLGNDSAALTKGEKQDGYFSGRFEERSFSGYRAYFEYLVQGSHQIEYTVRLNGAGKFQMPNSRIEAMYAPEMYAEVPNAPVSVR